MKAIPVLIQAPAPSIAAGAASRGNEVHEVRQGPRIPKRRPALRLSQGQSAVPRGAQGLRPNDRRALEQAAVSNVLRRHRTGADLAVLDSKGRSAVATTETREARDRMVDLQLAGRGIVAPRVLEAFRTVPREAFVPEGLAEFAYEDSPLPIGDGQTISQPYIVAVTVEALDAARRRAGARDRDGLRLRGRRAEPARQGGLHGRASASRSRRARASAWRGSDTDNVHVLCGDGTLGWPEHAPYDAIAVAAGGPEVPQARCSRSSRRAAGWSCPSDRTRPSRCSCA